MSILSALHLRNTIFDNIVSLRRALCGLIMIPPWLNTLSTGADVAGTDCTFIASSNSFSNSIMFLFQNSKQSWTSSPHWHMAKYFWYSASVESGCFADEVEAEVEEWAYLCKSFGILCGGLSGRGHGWECDDPAVADSVAAIGVAWTDEGVLSLSASAIIRSATYSHCMHAHSCPLVIGWFKN